MSFNLLSTLANHSLFNVASSGRCKSHIIFSIIDGCKTLPNTMINNWNAMTYYELVEKIGTQVNKSLLWTVEEWSMLSDYHRELLMAIASKVQTDRRFERMVKSGMYTQQILIENCDLMLLIAIQPFKFKKLMKESDNWNSLASDRFIKMMIINPLQADTKKIPPKFDLPEVAHLPYIGEDLKPNKILVEMFEDHLTMGRAQLAAIKYAEAWCRLNGTETFTERDASAFRMLYYPYLELFPMMIHSNDPDQEDSFYTGPFRILECFMGRYGKEFTVNDFVRIFHMEDIDISQRTIYRHLKVLESKGIIQSNSPQYSLAPYYHNYFENYRSNWT